MADDEVERPQGRIAEADDRRPAAQQGGQKAGEALRLEALALQAVAQMLDGARHAAARCTAQRARCVCSDGSTASTLWTLRPDRGCGSRAAGWRRARLRPAPAPHRGRAPAPRRCAPGERSGWRSHPEGAAPPNRPGATGQVPDRAARAPRRRCTPPPRSPASATRSGRARRAACSAQRARRSASVARSSRLRPLAEQKAERRVEGKELEVVSTIPIAVSTPS